jgi:hypothetical protein
MLLVREMPQENIVFESAVLGILLIVRSLFQPAFCSINYRD